ncbi:MAG: 30S ribosome-binding factor RbfA [Planctomyces sp.]|nr:30S ribosome-binding factor RbfA [Planctomyces sp.]
MSQRRIAKVSQAIRQVVSSAILMEMRDPRVKKVTVLNVEVPPDLRSAKVYVSVLGEDKDARLTLQGLNSARGWLQSRIADELDLRYTPILSFILDDGIKKSIQASQLLRGVLPDDAQPSPDDEGDEFDDDDVADDDLSAEAEADEPPDREDDSG